MMVCRCAKTEEMVHSCVCTAAGGCPPAILWPCASHLVARSRMPAARIVCRSRGRVGIFLLLWRVTLLLLWSLCTCLALSDGALLLHAMHVLLLRRASM